MSYTASTNKRSQGGNQGLRGAVPIVLATFPLLAGVPQASYLFDLVFFVVLVSVSIQGVSVPFVAKKLGVIEPQEQEATQKSLIAH